MKMHTLFIIAFLTFSSPFAIAVEEQQKTMSEKQMQERLKQMEKEMTEMRKTKDPQERRRLMNEHMGHMRDVMPDDMGCGAGGRMMGREPKQ